MPKRMKLSNSEAAEINRQRALKSMLKVLIPMRASVDGRIKRIKAKMLQESELNQQREEAKRLATAVRVGQ